MKVKRILGILLLLLSLTACTDNLYVKSGMYNPAIDIDTSNYVNTGNNDDFNLSNISREKVTYFSIPVDNMTQDLSILKSLDDEETEKLIETLRFLKKEGQLESFLNTPCTEELGTSTKNTVSFFILTLGNYLDDFDKLASDLITNLGGDGTDFNLFTTFVEDLNKFNNEALNRTWTNGEYLFVQTITNLVGGVVDIMQPIGSILELTSEIALDNFISAINKEDNQAKLTDAIMNKETGLLAKILVDNLAFVDTIGSITDGKIGIPTISGVIGSLL